MGELPTGTVTFLFTDIEGSTRLLAQTGSAYAGLVTTHARLLRQSFHAHGGEVVDTQGDSFFVAFARASDAVAAAVEGQRLLAGFAWPSEAAVKVRMGLHTGEGRVVEGHYIGMDVHRAARIAAAGHGGQILASETTEALVRGALPEGVSFDDLGEHRLKDLGRPERIFQAAVPGLSDEFPSLATLDLDLAPIQRPLSSFVGRERERRILLALLGDDDVRLLTLTGPGGIGKTRLALEVADAARDRFKDGVAVVPLAAVASADAVVSTILHGLRVPEVAGRSAREILIEYVRRKDLLLVLDNFEQVVAAAPLVGQLVEESARLKVLVTSREVLRITGEREYAVPPLGVTTSVDADSTFRSETVRLFEARARAVRPDFELKAENLPAVIEITKIVDGLPLGIELAAARMRVLSPEGIRDRLRKSFDVLAGGPRDLPERQRALSSAIDWSYRLLERDDRLLFEGLGVFEGGWSIEAMEKICGSPEIADPFESLSSLVDKSLVVRQGESRFTMLRSIHDFATHRLEEMEGYNAVKDRHADFYLSYGQEAARWLRTDRQTDWIDGLRAEYPNIRAAMQWALKKGRPRLVVEMGWALWVYWWVESRFEEGVTWMQRALASELSPDLEGRASIVLGILAFGRGDFDVAVPRLQRGSALSDEEENAFGAGVGYALLGVITSLKDPAEGQEFMARSLDRFVSIQDDWGIGFARYALGRVLLLADMPQEAVGILEEGVARLRKVGERALLALAMLNLGWALLGTNRVREATGILLEALERLQQLEDRQSSARLLEALAAAAHARGESEAGAILFGAAEGARRSIGAFVWIPDQKSHDSTERYLRAALPGPRFESLWNEGVALSPAQGLDIARRLMEREQSEAG